ncbi:MAG TPA: GreA/GreB family elongation factor [Polyangiaceae bacterium]|jgi:transcription elongation GreA/GreB family factor
MTRIPAGARPAPTLDKATLKSELATILAGDLAARERSHRAAMEAATHEEARPENDKDTRALELSYLARGEALRIEELRAALADVQALPVRGLGEEEPVGIGALVQTEDDSGERGWIWVTPHGGGTRLCEGAVQAVTTKSPLGRALLGKRRGEECEVRVAGKTRALTVVSVA